MSDTSPADLKYWLGFNKVKGIGPAKITALLDYFGTLDAAWNASESQLQKIGIDKRATRNLLQTRAELDLNSELASHQAAGISVIHWPSPDYPRYLKEIPGPPPVLFVRGEIEASDQWAIAVVGTRRLTTYGRQIARELVIGLASKGITIVSGLARGIDSVAHQAALDAGGRTLAVLGSGLDRIYPAENRNLARRILEGRGALLSEQALGAPPDAKNFPPRNRIISGLSLGVIVIEAGARSGALITARYALDQDREVFAVPGNVNSPASQGTNRLIQQGAKLVTNVEDILEELNVSAITEKNLVQAVVPETAEEALLLEHLSKQPVHIDYLTRQSALPSSMVSSTLSMMELKGLVHQVGGMNYVLSREPDPVYIVADEQEDLHEK